MKRLDDRSMVAMVAMVALSALGVLLDSRAAAAPEVAFVQGTGRVAVVIDGLPVAVYHYADDKISRPYFAHVRAPNGVQVTRHHPPIEGQDLVDHDTFHPGIWMSFGDISGSDYWRLAARVRHAEFVEPPRGGQGKGSFAVRNEYCDQKNSPNIVCEEIARYTFLSRPAGFLLLWDSSFTSDREFEFGDQEEMGLGFRVATPLKVGASGKGNAPPGNGTFRDSEGRKNGDQIWGNAADWCDCSGTIAGQRVGMTLFCHPKNFRPSWFHARDYGFLTANPFGREAFGKGEKSSLLVKPGEKLRLRFGVLLHSGAAQSDPDLAAAYVDYIELSVD